MRLWTMQSLAVLEELETKGEFKCDIEKSMAVEEKQYMSAYRWLMAQMFIRGIKLDMGKSPIWAWHTWNWKRKRPDLRCSGFDKRGNKLVCLELEIPENRVLLSDFDLWHDVLNDRYSSNTNNEEEYDNDISRYRALTEPEKEITKYRSWKNIFNIEASSSDWIDRGRYIQATIDKLYISDLRDKKIFIAK